MAFSANTVLLSVLILPLIATVLHSLWAIQFTPLPPTSFGTGSMFDQIADRYDMINRVLALNLDQSWRKRMISELLAPHLASPPTPTAPKQFLDLATGTADVALLLASEFPNAPQLSAASVTGIDPSQNMIDVGNRKIFKKEMDEVIKLSIGDVRDLPKSFEGKFDGITMAFGIRNVPERAEALCEIRRVIRSSNQSRLAILEFSEPQSSDIMSRGARLFIRHVVPILGAVLSGAPKEYMHLQNSIKEFPSPDEFVGLLESVECEVGEGSEKGGWKVEELIQMNFGSVQLYVSSPV